MSTLPLCPVPMDHDQHSSSWPHQGHRLWASMPVAFWVYFYKLQRCPLSIAHEWKDCPYSHPWERLRRRDPRTLPYLPEPCPDFHASYWYHTSHRTRETPTCVRGRTCRYAHGFLEEWLHQDRFRTCMCKAGVNCDRKICFFAHFSFQLRKPGDKVPFIDLRLLMPSWPLRTLSCPLSPPPRPAPPPIVAPAAAAAAAPPQHDFGGMMLQTRSGMRRISLTDVASASSFSWSSSSTGSSSSTSSGASSSSSPPNVVVAAVAAATTPPALGDLADDAATNAEPVVGYPADNEQDNAMSDGKDLELDEFPYFDIIRDFVL